MATQLFLTNDLADTHLGTNNTTLAGAATGWTPTGLSTSRGAGLVPSGDTPTVTGATAGVEIAVTGGKSEWISLPLSADVTISGAVTGNIWASESNMSANVAINFVVDVVDSATGAITQVVKSARVAEVAVTTRAANNFTATPGAGVACKRGDRLRVRIFGDDVGTMASGFTFNIGYNGPTGGADGDTYVSFTETFSFESAPAGTQIFLTDTASDVATASVDREAWTSRGGSSVTDVTNTAAGWTTPIQITDTAGGTVVDWFTKPLTGFTLGGICRFNIRALESSTAADASLKAEVAVVAGDGTSPTVLGVACVAIPGSTFEIPTTDTAMTADVGIDDTAITGGQRLRFRIYVDDRSLSALVTGHTVTVSYGGPTPGAAGDTYVTLPQSVTESAPASSLLPSPSFRQAATIYNL